MDFSLAAVHLHPQLVTLTSCFRRITGEQAFGLNQGQSAYVR